MMKSRRSFHIAIDRANMTRDLGCAVSLIAAATVHGFDEATLHRRRHFIE